MRSAGKTFGQRELAKAADVALSEVSAVLLRKRNPSFRTLAKLLRAVPKLEREALEEAGQAQEVVDTVKKHCQEVGLRQFAKQAGVDEANLASIFNGRRKSGQGMLMKLRKAMRGY